MYIFFKKSSDIHRLLVMNEDVVDLYRLFTNLFKFPGESP